MDARYLANNTPNPKGVSYYCPQPLLYILFSPFLKDKFDYYIKNKIGADYLTFYEGRNGIYHILKYLKDNFGSSRIFLPKAISPENSYSVIVACNKAAYNIVYYEGKPSGLKKNDVVIILDSNIDLPATVFTIEDNARNALMPDKKYDFTVYSFAIGKAMPSPRGGLILVNSKRMKGFLELRGQLTSPDLLTEFKSYIRYLLFYKVKNYGFIRSVMHWEFLYKHVKGDDFTHEYILHTNYTMCTISKKIASFVLK